MISFSSIKETDRGFLYDLYIATQRRDPIELDHRDTQKNAFFLRQQFSIQLQHYHQNYKCADFLLIKARGKPVGRLFLEERFFELRILDLSLMPRERNKGYRQKIIHGILRRAEETGRSIRVHVDKDSSLRQRYLDLGFKITEHRGRYDFMQWVPEVNVSKNYSITDWENTLYPIQDKLTADLSC
ncbi:hypothetical protein [Paremcibacter congregatus]|uniref:hypothetical protein n=1 Tax=Paremcibacter congregatus TaxID=2043170 RepID=UPI003A91A9DA